MVGRWVQIRPVGYQFGYKYEIGIGISLMVVKKTETNWFYGAGFDGSMEIVSPSYPDARNAKFACVQAYIEKLRRDTDMLRDELGSLFVHWDSE